MRKNDHKNIISETDEKPTLNWWCKQKINNRKKKNGCQWGFALNCLCIQALLRRKILSFYIFFRFWTSELMRASMQFLQLKFNGKSATNAHSSHLLEMPSGVLIIENSTEKKYSRHHYMNSSMFFIGHKT